jgi:hypothetical protein
MANARTGSRICRSMIIDQKAKMPLLRQCHPLLFRPDQTEKCVGGSHPGLLDMWYMNPFFLIFLLGQTFHGFGATPLFSLGTAFIVGWVLKGQQQAKRECKRKWNEWPNFRTKMCHRSLRPSTWVRPALCLPNRVICSLFAAIHSMLTSIGPIFGLFAGGKLLTIYEDFDRIDVTKWVKR